MPIHRLGTNDERDGLAGSCQHRADEAADSAGAENSVLHESLALDEAASYSTGLPNRREGPRVRFPC